MIIGAGPTGIGAALRLQELGHRDFLLIDAKTRPGGLAASHVDARGFTWDIGGHVHFSHYAEYHRLMNLALGGAWLERRRDAWIRFDGRYIPYPFQHNIHRLSRDDRDRAIRDLEQARARPRRTSPRTFRDWCLATFGRTIADLFMLPYNRKVWGCPPEMLSADWIAERVSVPTVAALKEQIRTGADSRTWGPNHTFRYPLRGGTGAIWTSLAARVPAARRLFGTRIVGVDLRHRTVQAASGPAIPYDVLISTAPLDELARMARGLPTAVKNAATDLRHSACHVLGVGLRGPMPRELRSKSWIYYPSPASPYHRVTILSNYSPYNTPPGARLWSLMAEVTDTRPTPIPAAALRRAVVPAMRRDGLIPPGAEIVSCWHRREEYAYPTPFLGRDEVLETLRTGFEGHGVYPRGRFGAWLYEVSNQDHSCMQGIEVVNRLAGLGHEETILSAGAARRRTHGARRGRSVRRASS